MLVYQRVYIWSGDGDESLAWLSWKKCHASNLSGAKRFDIPITHWFPSENIRKPWQRSHKKEAYPGLNIQKHVENPLGTVARWSAKLLNGSKISMVSFLHLCWFTGRSSLSEIPHWHFGARVSIWSVQEILVIGGTEYCVSVSCELASHDVIQKLQDLDVDDNT